MNTTKKTRKNILTGLVAGAAGIALLAGGTTFALWTSSAETTAATISAGQLSIVAGDQTWTDESRDSTNVGQPINLNTFKMVPGDVVKGSQTFDVNVEGDNLKARLDVDLSKSSLSGGLYDSKTIEYTYELKYTNAQGSSTDVPLGTGNEFQVPKGEGTLTGTIVLTYPKGVDGDTTGMVQTFAIGTVAFNLTQVR